MTRQSVRAKKFNVKHKAFLAFLFCDVLGENCETSCLLNSVNSNVWFLVSIFGPYVVYIERDENMKADFHVLLPREAKTYFLNKLDMYEFVHT